MSDDNAVRSDSVLFFRYHVHYFIKRFLSALSLAERGHHAVRAHGEYGVNADYIAHNRGKIGNSAASRKEFEIVNVEINGVLLHFFIRPSQNFRDIRSVFIHFAYFESDGVA